MLTEANTFNENQTKAKAFRSKSRQVGTKFSATLKSSKVPPKPESGSAYGSDAFQRYIAGISKYKLLTRSEEQALFKRVLKFDDKKAAQKLVTSNLRLVVKIAMDYSRLWMHNLLDLVQEGNIGLLKAVEKFNPEKNVKFSYYAAYWIKAFIIKHVMDNWRLVKIGTTQAQRKLFFGLKREKQKLRDRGFEPDAELISKRLGVSKKDVVEMDQRIGGWDVSLDAPLTEDSDTTRIELLKTPAESLEDRVSQKELQAILRQHIIAIRNEMDPRELEIFNQRIFADDPKTLSEIGKQYGISKERVRQIQKAIILKLKNSFKHALPDFVVYSEGGLTD